MATTTEGTGNGSAERTLPRLLNGVAKLENVPALESLTERLQAATVEFHVAKHGTEGATGSPDYPFPTIQEAVDHAESTVQEGLGYVVNVHPGFYAETVTLSRAKAHLRGTHAYNEMTMFCSVSRIVIDCAEDMDGASNTQYAVSGMLVASSSGDCISITGDTACTVVLKDCNLYADGAGQKCLSSTNNAEPKVKVNGVVFNNVLSNAPGATFFSGWLELQRCFFYTGNSQAVDFGGQTLTMDGVLMQNAGDDVLFASGSGSLSISNCLFENSKANSNGIRLAGTVTCTAVQNVFRVPSGTGYAVAGPAGCILVHGLNCYLPGYNSKVKSSMTIVPATTTPTASA
jgi:hypothetical protein